MAALLTEDADASFDAQARVEEALANACGGEALDLVILNRAGPMIGERVARSGRCLYARSGTDRARFESDAIKRALDYQPYSRIYDRALFLSFAKGGSMAVDREVLATRLGKLRDALRHLRGIAEMPREAYIGSERDRLVAERCLHLAIESALDAGNHVIVARGLRKPQHLREIPLILQENGVLRAELARRLADAAGLRNRLVHAYAEIDHELVHELLQSRLDDLEQLAAALAELYLAEDE